MSALLKVKNHASVSQQKVFWKNQTFSSLSRSVKLVMAIVTVLAIKTVVAIVTFVAVTTVMAIVTALASSPSFRTRAGYRIQGTRSRVAKSSSHQSGGRRDVLYGSGHFVV